MRPGLAILALLLPAVALLPTVAVAQKPYVAEQKNITPSYAVPGPPLTPEEVEELPPDEVMTVLVENKSRTTTAANVLVLLRQGTQVRSLRVIPEESPACPVDYSEINAERRASDERRRQMERRGEVIPVLHQYEQEIYFEDLRAKLYEKTCGKPYRKDRYLAGQPDMRQKACEALGTVCKPRKHW